MTWVLVAVGGAIGSLARHSLNHLIQRGGQVSQFPVGIFIINVLGSAAIGVVAGLVTSGRWPASIEARTFVMVGLLGGFRTFSSFSLDTLGLLQSGQHLRAALNIGGQVGLSLIGVWLGFTIARG